MSVKTESLAVYEPPVEPWQERLFCVRSSDLATATGGDQGFLPLAKYHKQFGSAFWGKCNISLMPRDTAESAEEWKQLVAYILVEDEAGRILVYRRCKKQGETRLMGLKSIGVGGHVESRDIPEAGARASLWGCPKAVPEAAIRELKEELGVTLGDVSIIGYINDDSNPVGRVHFGVVFLAILSPGTVVTYRDGVTEPEWHYLDDIAIDDLEPWSQMVLLSMLSNRS
jgi:predicted NUDIX family phosphoesterase